MGEPFHLEVHPAYIHFKLPNDFVATLESTGEAWVAVGKFCEQNRRHKVLIEATKPDRQMDTMASFESGRILAENATGVTVAICLHDYEFDELSSFFKTVAQNRGVKMELFTNLDEAYRWLDVDTGENAAGHH